MAIHYVIKHNKQNNCKIYLSFNFSNNPNRISKNKNNTKELKYLI